MTSKRNASYQNLDEELHAIESFWRWSVPEAFRRLFLNEAQRHFAPCEFFSADEIVRGAGRMFGQLPQFLPFGRVAGEDSLYGFYVSPLAGGSVPDGRAPVLYWDEAEAFLRPVASDFEAFLRRCIVAGRYETEDEWPGAAIPDRTQLELFRTQLSVPPALFECRLPRNDTDLYQRLASLDAQDSLSLCHLGCAARANGDDERALDFFHRASEASPWFGDTSYLLADIHRRRENYARAIEGYWAVVNRPVALCTRTWEWDLGEDHPDADVYEVAADAITQFADAASDAVRESPLWRIVTREDAYDPNAREQLAKRFAVQGRLPDAERELLTALSLTAGERSRQPERIYARLVEVYARMRRERDAALAQFDAGLPRQTV
ncbi:MAG TPA: SMI1/KNR4 family protein [Chthonomonadaceae bacterium]|nr:SMI1/KNR4 family protein [Chthonomonadaceae bacterium]